MNNIAIRGGGSAGLAYFQLWKEVEQKKLKFNNYSGSSAGVVLGVPIMSGMSSKDGLKLFKSISGDECMAYKEQIKKAKWYKKPFMIIKYFAVMRLLFSKSCKKLAKKHFSSWNKINKRCKKSYISFCLQKDAVRFLGKNIVKNISKYGSSSALKIKSKESIMKAIREIPVYYASDDGVYRYNSILNKLDKISNKSIHPWKAFLATFSNPLLSPVMIKTDGIIPHKTIDGGLIDNWATCPHAGQDYFSLGCESPEAEYTHAIDDISNYLRILNPPKKTFVLEPLTNRELLDFRDSVCEDEYNRDASNFF